MADTSAVVVHGLWMPGTETQLIRRRLEREGFASYVFRYRSVRLGLAANAERFAEFLDGLPGAKVHMVGHSLGGVLILEALAKHAFERQGRVVCLGSPLNGSSTATGLTRYPITRGLIGKSMHNLLERGGLAHCGDGREVGIIAGDYSVGFGRLVGGLARPNDGTVSVAETRLAGACDHIVLPVSHFSLLYSMDVMRQILWFLNNGKFRRDANAPRE